VLSPSGSVYFSSESADMSAPRCATHLARPTNTSEPFTCAATPLPENSSKPLVSAN
jgi:hypothetical protein